MASNQAKVFGGRACALDKGAARRKWPSWLSALNPPLASFRLSTTVTDKSDIFSVVMSRPRVSGSRVLSRLKCNRVRFAKVSFSRAEWQDLIHSRMQQIYVNVVSLSTRKLCYRKDDRAMRSI